MPITVNTNASASYANFHLSKNQSALQKSLTRLSSGSRITQPIDDAGGLAVSLKLQSAITDSTAPRRTYRTQSRFSRCRTACWKLRARS